MAMGMNDFFYGASEPTYFVNHSRHLPYSSEARHAMLPGYGFGHAAPVVELLVPMCCSKCEEKVRENMLELDGVHGVMVDRQHQRVAVTGFVDPLKALKKAKKVKKDSQLLSGASYARHGGQYSSSGKHYRQHDLAYRTSYNQYRPSVYRSSHSQHTPSVYRSSYNQYTPSYGPSYLRRSRSMYDDGYSHVITNPHYIKHIESEY